MRGPRFFALVRYNSDGSLDTSFDGDGKVTTDFAGDEDHAGAVAIQGDGKIVAAGTVLVSGTGYDFAVARYSTDGTLDETFDGDGTVTTDFGGADLAFGGDSGGRQNRHRWFPRPLRLSDFALARYRTE